MAPSVRGSLVAIVPTRNESGSIGWIIPRLIRVGAYVVIVDDASSDRTAATAERLIRRHRGRGLVIRRPAKLGRGSAIADGLRASLDRYPRAIYFVELDADGSHDPLDTPKLVSAMRGTKADLVIGSRAFGGADDRDRELHRRLFHRAVTWLIRTVLNLPVQDTTAGFRLWSRPATELIVRAPLREKGFVAVAEWTDATRRAGGKIVEVPVGFYERRAGRSKVDARELICSLLGLFRIRLFPPRVRRIRRGS